MICPSCRHENANHLMFCMRCGGRLPQAPAGEPGGAPMGAGGGWPRDPYAPANASPAAGARCASCGSGRTVQGAIGPTMGARVFPAGRQLDLPIAAVRVCADCGHVALALADDARRYLAGMLGA